MVPYKIFQMDVCIFLKSLKPDTVDWGARPPFVSCFTNPAVPHHSSLFQGCHWIASKPFPDAPRSLDKWCFYLTTPGRHWRREPFEITVLMKHEKLQALRRDFMSTRELEDHPYAVWAQGSKSCEYTNIQKHTRLFLCTRPMHVHKKTSADISVQ